MSQPLKINVVLSIIGMVKHVTIINIIVLMVLIGMDRCVSLQVHASKVIIKIRVDIVLLFHKHVYLQQYGMVKSVKLMGHVHLVPTIVEVVVRIMFHVKMDMFGIGNISHVIAQKDSNQMDIHV